MDIDLKTLSALIAEKGISMSALLPALRSGLLVAYQAMPNAQNGAWVEIEEESGRVSIKIAQKDEEGNQTGTLDVTPRGFGRVASQEAKQVVMKAMRDEKDRAVIGEFSAVVGDIVTGVIQQGRDPKLVYVDLGKTEGTIPPSEQVPGEKYEHGAFIKALVVEVKMTPRGPQITLSRTHPNLVKKLFELEVPEVASGLVEIKAVSREAGHRSKMAVLSHRSGVNPKGACIGPMGQRSQNVTNELNGEKIDIVEWSLDPAKFLSEALAPSRVVSVEIVDLEARIARVVVPDFQLSLAIGREGQNARLAARLTSWKIDIRSDGSGSESTPDRG